MHYRAGLLSTGSLLRRPSQLEHKMTTRGGGPRLRTSETVGGARPAGHAAGHSTRQTPNHAILDAAFHAERIAAVAPGLGAELVLEEHPRLRLDLPLLFHGRYRDRRAGFHGSSTAGFGGVGLASSGLRGDPFGSGKGAAGGGS